MNFISTIVAYIKLFFIFLVLLITCFLMAIFRLLFINPRFMGTFFASFLFWIFKMNIKFDGKLSEKRPLLVIANHTSFLDIVLLYKAFKVVFVAKSDMKKWPLVGFLTASAGNIFIERNPAKAKKEVKNLAKAIDEKKEPILIFPEGTTSNGSEILPFKSAMFQVVEHQLGENRLDGKNITIQPVVFSLHSQRGRLLTDEEKENLAYYKKEDTLINCLVRALKFGSTTTKIKVLQEVDLSKFNDRKELAGFCEEVVRKGFENL